MKMDLVIDSIQDWLDVTPQQLEIVQSIYKLELDELTASPKQIQQEYRKRTGKYLMKPNLFNILRILQQRGYVAREGVGDYHVNLDGIKHNLKAKESKLRKDLENFINVSANVESHFIRLADRMRRPAIQYLDQMSLYNEIADKLSRAERLYATARLPAIAYTYASYAAIGRGPYHRILQERALIKMDLEVDYLTCLDTQSAYRHSMELYQDQQRALREAQVISSNLGKIIKNYPLISISYLPDPFGCDMLLSERGKQTELFMFLRDQKMEVRGGMHIRCRNAAHQAKETFMSLKGSSLPLSGLNGARFIKSKTKELEMTSAKINTLPIPSL